MKLEKPTNDYLDLSYEIPSPGVSICKFEEGIAEKTNEKSGKTSLRLPMSVIEVIDGEPDNEGKKLSHFVPIMSGFGEKQLLSILAFCGLLEPFATKFKSEIDPLDGAFLNQLKLKLPGRTVKVSHDVRVDSKGKNQPNVTRIEPVGKPQKAKAQVQAQAQPAEPGSEDW